MIFSLALNRKSMLGTDMLSQDRSSSEHIFVSILSFLSNMFHLECFHPMHATYSHHKEWICEQYHSRASTKTKMKTLLAWTRTASKSSECMEGESDDVKPYWSTPQRTLCFKERAIIRGAPFGEVTFQLATDRTGRTLILQIAPAYVFAFKRLLNPRTSEAIFWCGSGADGECSLLLGPQAQPLLLHPMSRFHPGLHKTVR